MARETSLRDKIRIAREVREASQSGPVPFAFQLDPRFRKRTKGSRG